MKEKPIMAQQIRELRKAKGLTQAQLAQETNLKEAAIRSYENGLREPNSKAMVALERYFKVSGEYLRGEIDRETFTQNSATIQGNLDTLVDLFQIFHQDFHCCSQERQLLAVSVVSGILQTVTEHLLRHDGPTDLDREEVNQIFRAAFKLNTLGRSELAKRAEELTQLAQYRE